MVLHINKKIAVVALVIALLVTVFSSPNTKAKASLTAQKNKLEISETGIISTDLDLQEANQIDALALTAVTNPSSELHFSLKATGYNSLANQTDSTPFITATGARTEFGVIAVSRDLLSDDIPYGSLVKIKDLGNYYNGRGAGSFQTRLDEQEYFIVEDTMHIRKKQQIDVWFPKKSEALNWGIRQVELEVIRFGRSGPIFSSMDSADGAFAVD